MIRSITLSLSAACLALALMIPMAAHAETKISVVDTQKILVESKASKGLQADVQSLRDKFVEELSKREETLRKEEKDLIEKGKTASKEDFEKSKKDFEKKFDDARKDAQSKKKKLDDSVNAATEKLKAEIFKAVKAVADEKGFDLVLAKQNVVVGDKVTDITQESLDKLNAAVTKISVDAK